MQRCRLYISAIIGMDGMVYSHQAAIIEILVWIKDNCLVRIRLEYTILRTIVYHFLRENEQDNGT